MRFVKFVWSLFVCRRESVEVQQIMMPEKRSSGGSGPLKLFKRRESRFVVVLVAGTSTFANGCFGYLHSTRSKRCRISTASTAKKIIFKNQLQPSFPSTELSSSCVLCQLRHLIQKAMYQIGKMSDRALELFQEVSWLHRSFIVAWNGSVKMLETRKSAR